jgi:hypothetical protein
MKKHSIVEDGDTFTLGRFYAMWYPGASLMQVLSVASTLKYTGVQQLDPIEQALKFVKGYMQVSGPFYEAPEQSNRLVTDSMKPSEFTILLSKSREQRNATIDREVALAGYMNELDSLTPFKAQEREVTTMASTTKTQTAAQKLIAEKQAKQAQQKTDNPGSYEENKSGYINVWEISGNLGRDTEINTTTTGKVVAKNGLGVFNPGKHSDEKNKTKWVDLALWFEDGVNDDLFVAFTSMEKGQKVVVKGKLTFRYWNDREGAPRETAVLTITDIA